MTAVRLWPEERSSVFFAASTLPASARRANARRERPPMKKVKYGVLGLGWFGEKHCEALAAIPNVEIHSLCTRNPERLGEVAKKFGAKKTFTDFDAMLADPELDAVSITTMWDQHAAPTLAALKAGKHVFLEKPMASTMADC